ncbi:forkhead box protein N1-like [Xyrauchen texanus]|uniref:forkhead box protein N1-like n=1 Tax=Xyrauchen texanus TaxID=154827 RepID=UPI002241B365|nr:forkhead box protein N1-like [Xyrauchen texanus]
MSSEPEGQSFPSTSNSSSPVHSPGQLHSFDHLGTPCFQMPESQCKQSNIGEGFAPYSESVPYRQKSAIAERFRRHSVNGSPVGQEPGLVENRHFHPYSRQCSERAVPEVHAFSFLRGAGLSGKLTTGDGSEEQSSWTSLSNSVETTSFMGTQQPYNEPQMSSEEPPSYTSVTHQTYSPISPLQHQFSGVCSSRGIYSISNYLDHNLSSQTSQDSAQPLYPKPVYSYSILIFLALRNSKTGSLPVSEIYSFVTKHFPYFKTAPDGWKNSVRHNLSLNKCFEKVENKKGNSFRKGCLWGLNPAKVEKMQEDLYKWRLKDPLTVQRSMARPEELERLLGEIPEKQKTLGAYFSLSSSHIHSQPERVGMHTSYRQPSVHETIVLHQKPLYSHLHSQTVPPPPPYISPDSLGSSYYSPVTQLPSIGHPSRTGNLDSNLPAHTSPNYSTALQGSHSAAGGIHELLLEGEFNDVDALNPSLTDLQLHGYLWEELRNDSLAPDSLVVMDTYPSLSPTPDNSVGIYGQSAVEVGTVGTEGGVQGSVSKLYLNGLHTTAFAVTDGMPGLHSYSGNTPIPLL